MSDDLSRQIERAVEQAALCVSRNNLAVAEIICREILAAAPDHAFSHYLLGVIAGRVGLREQSIACFEAALVRNPADAESRKNIAIIRNTPLPPPDGRPRYLLIRAAGSGFWSDVTHVLGCLLIAELSGRIPVTHWGSNSLFGNGSTEDSFRHFFQPVSDVTWNGLSADIRADVFPRKWRDADPRGHDHQRWNGEGSRLAGLYFINRPEALAVSDFYVGIVDLLPWIPPSHALYGKSLDEVYRVLIARYLKPHPAGMAEVEVFSRNLLERDAIAVHVRGSDKKTEHPGLDDFNESFFALLDRENPRCPIFLMTDDERWLARFRQRYGERILTTNSQRTATDTGIHHSSSPDRVRLGREVMMDAYLALSCRKFIGNGRSTVSAMVKMLKSWKDGDLVLLAPSILSERTSFPFTI